MNPKQAMDKVAAKGASPDQVRRAGQRAADMPFYLILAFIFLIMVISGLAAAGLLGG